MREAAEKEAVIVMGTIWLVNQMVKNCLITVNQTRQAYKKMKDAGRRLPWNIAEEKLSEIQNGHN